LSRSFAGARPRWSVEVLTTRDCADWVGYSTEWIRRAINAGVTAPSGRTVKLEAATVRSGRRRCYRVYREAFVDFLITIAWTKIPGQRVTVHPFRDQKAVAPRSPAARWPLYPPPIEIRKSLRR
jgi:hypothetical protein